MLYRQIQENKRKTIWLVIVFCLVVMIFGGALGFILSESIYLGLIITAIVLIFYIPFTYMSAGSQVLSMSGAREIKKADHPQLFGIIEELVIPARLPMPKVYIVNDPAPNAFATGIKPEKSAVAFTTGLLDQLNREELAGVAAHELGHIRNYDIRLMTICIALVSLIIIMTDVAMRMLFFGGRSRSSNNRSNPIILVIALAVVILAPIVAQMIRFAVSRNREFLADATAVELTRNPQGLIKALKKISQDKRDVEKAKDATASMYIARPLNRKRKNRGSAFATHPPMEERIERLENM